MILLADKAGQQPNPVVEESPTTTGRESWCSRPRRETILHANPGCVSPRLVSPVATLSFYKLRRGFKGLPRRSSILMLSSPRG